MNEKREILNNIQTKRKLRKKKRKNRRERKKKRKQEKKQREEINKNLEKIICRKEREMKEGNV